MRAIGITELGRQYQVFRLITFSMRGSTCRGLTCIAFGLGLLGMITLGGAGFEDLQLSNKK